MGHDLHPDPRLGHARRLRGSAVASLSPRPAAALPQRSASGPFIQTHRPSGDGRRSRSRARRRWDSRSCEEGSVELVVVLNDLRNPAVASSVTRSHFSRRAALAAFLLRLLPRRRRVRAAYARAQAASGAAMLLAKGELTIALSRRSDWPYDGVQKLRMLDERLLLKNRASRSLQPEPRAASPAHLNRTVERIRCSRAARNGPCRDQTSLLIDLFCAPRYAPRSAPNEHWRPQASRFA
jgi:hypothetical protein